MGDSQEPSPEIILYIYTFSPYGRKVTQYLTLRGIPYTTVEQPPVMPRPDLATIGVKYRRIPVMSIGRDIYCDTLLILQKLEELYPGPSSLAAKSAKDKALETLLEKFMSDSAFQRAVGTIPGDFPAMNDPNFCRDRGELWGGEWGKERQDKMRPNSLKEAQEFFEFLEGLIGHGGPWALGEVGPGLADIHALWLFDWLLELCPGSLPADTFSVHTYPETFAWRDRYRAALAQAHAQHPDLATELGGPAAAYRILRAGFAEREGQVDTSDPVALSAGLKKGTLVDVWPSDTTVTKKDYEHGELVALNRQEAVVRTRSKTGVEVRVHTPRWNYTVSASPGKVYVRNGA